MKRPALASLAAVSAGIIFGRLTNIAPGHLAAAAILTLLFALFSFLSRKRVAAAALFGLCSLVSFGFLLLGAAEYRFEHSAINRISAIYSGETVIYGRIVSTPTVSASSYSFFLESDSLRCDSLLYFVHEKINVSVLIRGHFREESIPTIGEKVKLIAELEHIEAAKNPYEIAYNLKLKEYDGASARAYLRSQFDLYIIDSSQNVTAIENAQLFFQHLYDESRHIIATATDDSLTQGFLSAVVLGDKSKLAPEVLNDFQRAGLTHLLVVSGFNVSIVAALVFYILRLIGLSFRRVRIALSMLFVLFYSLIVGLEPSVVRALIVVEFIFFAKLLERKPDFSNLTASAALISITINPYDLFNIGFQLSYGAVFSLIFFYPTFEQIFIPEKPGGSTTFLRKSRHRILQGFFGSLAVFLGLLPVFLYHFHRISVVGLGLNILAIPLTAMITIVGFLLLPTSLISTWLGSLYGEACCWMAKIIGFAAHFSGGFEWSVIEMPRPQIFLIACYIGAIVYLLRTQTKKKFYARLAIILSIVFASWSLSVPFAYSLVKSNDNVSLLFFDVGQGDAILLSTPKKYFLIDFGGITKNYNAIADESLIPLFKAEGLGTIEGGFVTHMHIDHYGGAVSMIQHSGCKTIYTSGERTSGYAAYRLDSISQALHIPVIRIHQGDKIHVGDDLNIYVLNPESITDEVALPLSSEGMNHHSLALKVVYKNSSALLLGDIEASDEERLCRRYRDFLRSDIVKVAHHGSLTSSSPMLVTLAKPHYAVISVGKHNTFGHPSVSVLKRWIHSQASVLRTDKDGALLFQSDGRKFERVNWR